MQKPQIPFNEPERLAALQRYDILDTLPEQEFDDLTQLAAAISGSLIALISLVDQDRQWFKSKVGIEATETPRDISFCGHVVMNEETLIVSDATQDDRFADNPLVAGELGIRFYVGTPLVTSDNYVLGTLCVIDRYPRTLTPEQLTQLESLSRLVISQLELRLTDTKLTKINQQLAISNQQLLRATRLKDEFLANMSHELRTPLNAILGMTEGLEDEVFGEINPQQLNALQVIDSSGSHLLELINDILNLAKIEAGQITLEYTSVSVEHLCQSSLAFIKHQAIKKQIQLEVKLPTNLPDIMVDERRIRQVLINILNNAIKFTPEGGQITLEVIPDFSVLPPYPQQSILKISITDTGIGISSENIQKVFQPFVQIDSALNRQYSGTGLGLALVQQIVELNGGKVWLTSEWGMGICFSIELPWVSEVPPCLEMSTEDQAGDQAEDQARDQGEDQVKAQNQINSLDNQSIIPSITPSMIPSELDSPTPKPSPLILLAEDNEDNISTFSSYLEAKGYRILLAKDGQEAIDLAKSRQPELILMDIQMPGMDGLEAIKRIRLESDLSKLPIIALTALAMSGDRERCLAAGANEYLSKPVRLKQLVITIENFLSIN